MKFSGKMWFLIILKVTPLSSFVFTLSLPYFVLVLLPVCFLFLAVFDSCQKCLFQPIFLTS